MDRVTYVLADLACLGLASSRAGLETGCVVDGQPVQSLYIKSHICAIKWMLEI